MTTPYGQMPPVQAAAEREARIEYQRRALEETAEARRRYLGLNLLPPATNGVLTERLMQPRAEVPWFVGNGTDGLARAGHRVLLVSRYKTGKTTLLAHLGKSLCDGDAFLGKYTAMLPPGKRVGYSDLEMESEDTDAYLAEAGVINTNFVAAVNLKGYRVPFASDPDAKQWMTWWLWAHQVGVWIIDTLTETASHHSISLRSDEIMTVLHGIDEIAAQAGVTNVIVSSHIPHGNEEGFERAYGDQAISAWADAIWTLSKEGPRSDAPRLFSAFGRRVPDLEPHVLDMTPSNQLELTDMVRGEGSLAQIKGTVLQAIIAHQMSANGSGPTPLTAKMIQATLHKNREQILAALHELADDGMIKNTGTGVPGPGSSNWVTTGAAQQYTPPWLTQTTEPGSHTTQL